MNHRHLLWLLALVAMAGGVVAWFTMRPTAGMRSASSTRVEPAPPPSSNTEASLNDSQSTITLLNDVIGTKNAITDEDAGQVVRAFAEYEGDVVVQRWALAVSGDLIRRARMSDSTRRTLEELILSAMFHENWRLRRAAIACIDGSAFIARADVRAIVEGLQSDPKPEVAVRAQSAIARLRGGSSQSPGGAGPE